MTKEEVHTFIEIMDSVLIHYTPEEVEEEFGGLTLRQAVEKRLNRIQSFFDFVEETVEPEAKALGLWPEDHKVTRPDPIILDDL